MSEQALAHLANPDVQRQIAAAGGALPNLAEAAQLAEAETLKKILDQAVTAATGILQGSNAKAGDLVSTANELARQITANQKAQNELARARQYFAQTNNIFPLRKIVLGVSTPRDILAQFPDIDKIPENWTPTAGAAAVAA